MGKPKDLTKEDIANVLEKINSKLEKIRPTRIDGENGCDENIVMCYGID